MLLVGEMEPESSDHIESASFWSRLLAFVIDIVLVIVSLLFTRLLTIAPELSNLLFPNQSLSDLLLSSRIFELTFLLLSFWLYYSFMESSKTQATVGKIIVGMRVVDPLGERIRFAQASGRFFIQLGSLLLLGIGHLFALFTEKNQTLHDILSGCEVVKGRVNLYADEEDDH